MISEIPGLDALLGWVLACFLLNCFYWVFWGRRPEYEGVEVMAAFVFGCMALAGTFVWALYVT